MGVDSGENVAITSLIRYIYMYTSVQTGFGLACFQAPSLSMILGM